MFDLELSVRKINHGYMTLRAMEKIINTRYGGLVGSQFEIDFSETCGWLEYRQFKIDFSETCGWLEYRQFKIDFSEETCGWLHWRQYEIHFSKAPCGWLHWRQLQFNFSKAPLGYPPGYFMKAVRNPLLQGTLRVTSRVLHEGSSKSTSPRHP